MAIYKSSLHSPNLEEVDLSQNNTFSCMVNTSGEPIRAYKMQILSGRGDEVIYGLNKPNDDDFITKKQGNVDVIELKKPIKNKNMLNIKNISSSKFQTNKLFDNGKDYQWGIRVYNQPLYSTIQPNTLVCDGYLVGSTKNVVWCKIPDQTGNNKNIVDQIVYDRYIEFDVTSNNMIKGAKDDISIQIPDTLKERRKIDWVTKELGYNKNILKIETTESFSFNYIDGTPFKIYQCSDEHTLKSFFVDPNSNINISNYIVLFNSATDANEAHKKGYKPSLTEISGDKDPEGDTTPHTAQNMFGTPQKIIGYSSDTGEIRLGKSYSTEPKNNQAYLIFEYDAVNKVCKEITPTIEASAAADIKNNPYLTQVVGGRAISDNNLYKVMTNRWDNTAKRLFIQPNINIKSDDTNPNEIVFDDGTRVDINKQYWINNGVEVDITFDKLDDTQWLLTTDSNNLNESGKVPQVVSGTPPVIPQTDYKVYTDFMDSMPFNVFYARTTPVLEVQYRDLNKQKKLEKEGEQDEPFVYFNGVRFEEDLRSFFLDDKIYKELNEEYIKSDMYPMSLKDYFPSISNNDYYNSVLEMVGSYTAELVNRFADNETIDEEDIEEQIEMLYQHYNSAGVPLRNIQFNTEFNAPDGQGIKYYHYYLYAYKDQVAELIAQSEDLYSTELIWSYRGFLSETKYNIKISVIDEYDKEFVQSTDFNILYGTEKASAPLKVEFDCDKKAVKVTATSPEYAIPTLPNLMYLSSKDKSKVGTSIQIDKGQICYILEDESYEVWNGSRFEPSELMPITENNIYNDENSVFDDYIESTENSQVYYDTVLDDSFPNTKIQIPINFSFLTQFQITDQFIENIPFTSNNKKSKIAALGYEYFNADKYKVKCINIKNENIDIEEVKYTLPTVTQAEIGKVKYLIYSRSKDFKDNYHYYYCDDGYYYCDEKNFTWEKIKEVNGLLPTDASLIYNNYNNYCVLIDPSNSNVENGCYQYIDGNWKLLTQLTPEKNEKDYLDMIADVFVVSNVEYQWLDGDWAIIKTYKNSNEFASDGNKDTTNTNRIYKIGSVYYNPEKDGGFKQLDLNITVCDNGLPFQNFVYDFQKEITYGDVAYSVGNYIWKDYLFISVAVQEVLDVSNTTFLNGAYYYFPTEIYYDGNSYDGYYLWEDGRNNEFKSLYLFLNNCKGFNYENGNLIKNNKRCYIELYDVEDPDENTEPLNCFITGKATNGEDIIANHVNLFALGGNIPAPENYKYAIQDNLFNEYQFANTLGTSPRQGEKYRVYSLSEKELSSLLKELEGGSGSLPTEDADGNPYGVYTWNKEYNKWIIEPTDYGYIENVSDLIGYGLKNNSRDYDTMNIKERYDYLSVPQNCRGGETGDLLWTDGNEQVYGSLPQTPKKDIVYQLIDSVDKEKFPDGYYKNTNGIWEENYDLYYYKTVDGITGYYIWESWDDTVENKEKVVYTPLLHGTPNARNIWIDNSAYSYGQLITIINKIWLTLYLTVTYNETNPIRCIIKAQDKWEG